MWELILFFVGVVFQLGGVALTIAGARTVWKGIKAPDDRFLAPFMKAGRLALRLARRLGIALGMPGRAQVIKVDIVDIGTAVDRVTVTQAFAPLPGGLTTEQAVRTLDERLREVQALAYSQAAGVEQRIRQAVEDVAAEQQRIAREGREGSEQDRRRAVVGVRLEAYGFILLTIGTLVQAIGSYLGIDVPRGC